MKKISNPLWVLDNCCYQIFGWKLALLLSLTTLFVIDATASGLSEEISAPTGKESKFDPIIGTAMEKSVEKNTFYSDKTKKDTYQFNVTGTVTDTNGQPLPGANIVEKGTTNGVQTDFDGNFSLSLADENGTLVVSYIGFAAKEIPVDGQSTFTIALEESAAGLDEVIVVGYGSQSKESLTGSVATVDEEELNAVPTGGDAASRMQGRVAGVTITTNSAPGGNAVVRVRGVGSINNNDPLYVIDGVPTTTGLSGVNPNDIESMTVLKDAASSAIYGSRAANGVILVTTKRGSKGRKPSLSLSVRSGVQRANNNINLLNTEEVGLLKWQKFTNDGLEVGDPGWGDLQYGNGATPQIPDYIFPNGRMEGEVDESLYNFGDPYYGITRANKQGTDWLDEIFTVAPIQEYNLSVSGGTEDMNYAISGGYLNQEGILNHTGFDRYSLRANTDINITDWFKVGQSLSLTRSNRKGNLSTSAIEYALRTHPIIPVYDIRGNFAGTQSKGTGNAQNPVAILYRDKDDFSRQLRILANVYLQFNLTDDLSFKTMLGVDSNNRKAEDRTLANPEFTQTNFNNSLELSHNEGFQYNFTNTLNYSKTIREDHSLDVLLGMEQIKNRLEYFAAGRSSFAFTDLDYMILNAGTENQTNEGFFDEWALFSFFGRVNYNYKGKYLFEAVARRDGSSRFNEENRWGVFPAFSAGWRVSDEKFMADVDWLNSLKLRVGWGQNGNDNVGNYNAYSTYRADGFESYYNLSGSGSTSTQAGFHAYKLGNPDSRWETNTTTNIGVDFSILDYRFDASVDVYTRKTTDMLYPDVKPDTWGALELSSVNVGEMRNSGIDLIMNYRSDIDSPLQYTISANLSHYKNEVIRLNDNPDEIRFGNSLLNDTYTATTPGRPISSFFGYIVDGYFNTQEEVDSHAPYNPDVSGVDAYSRPGVFKYRDVNGDGVIDPDDRTFIGSPHPDLSYGLNMNFKYKNWDMTMFFQGVLGNDLVNFSSRTVLFNRFDGNYLKKRLYESWTPERYQNGDRITVPISLNDDSVMQRPSTFFVEDGSYFRMKNFELGYSFSEKVLEKLGGLNRFRIYLQTTNLFTITNYSGIDPETSSGDDRQIGVDSGLYPPSQIFMMGININL
ncbi:MAG: hypothetical protein CMH44_02565 [Muricauda sp.]|nr:hypothetical protein [Allomuricauda sp.]